MDVLIVGSGPAGMLLAAQLSQFPEVVTRIIERRDGRLVLGQADGIQPRSVETFQAFGFAPQIIAEAYNIAWMNYWTPDPVHRENIIRTTRQADYAVDMGEFPHLIVNQARVLDYFAEAAVRGPGRIVPDYGVEFVGLVVREQGEYPVEVTVRYVAGPREGEQRVVRAKYVGGADGARSQVRESIGRKHIGDFAQHAWGVMDVTVNTDFPDWRTKCAINAEAGNILLIPREGGYLCRVYVDLGEVPHDDKHRVRETSLERIVEKANEIVHPYTIDVKQAAWHSVYEVGHRVTDKFDDVDIDAHHAPHVFLMGDACHTHSAKAGQGMNVSMQDGFNLGWKLGSVLVGRSPASLLETYSAERQPVAQELIDFDREWSSLMARKPEDFDDPQELAEFYLKTAEFPSGFMTRYPPSTIVSGDARPELATGFPLGKRFTSAQVVRVSDGNTEHIGHHHTADGRWRVYVFADGAGQGEASALDAWARWALSPHSPFVRFTPADGDTDAVFDVKVVYQQPFDEIELFAAPEVFRPHSGPLDLMNWEKVYATGSGTDIFDERGLSRDGVIVVVRPDQYVAHVLPLTATNELAEFFAGVMLEATG
jgi:phenol 2-monooxygenase